MNLSLHRKFLLLLNTLLLISAVSCASYGISEGKNLENFVPEATDRSIHLQPSDPTTELALPTKADRAGKASGSRHLPVVHQRAATFAPVGKAMIAASEEEAAQNPRARSAKLRSAVRTEAPPEADDMSIFDLPNLASLGKMGS